MDYENKSDIELSKLTLQHLISDHLSVKVRDFPSEIVVVVNERGDELNCFDINNWNDIMSIAFDFGFDVEMPDENLGDIGQITKYMPNDTDIMVEFSSTTREAKRAIAICFLKMKDAENGR